MSYSLVSNTVFVNGYTRTAIVCFSSDSTDPVAGITIKHGDSVVSSGLASYYDHVFGCHCVKFRLGGAKIKIEEETYTEVDNDGSCYKNADEDEFVRIIEYGKKKFWCKGSNESFSFSESSSHVEVDYANPIAIPESFGEMVFVEESSQESYSVVIGEQTLNFNTVKYAGCIDELSLKFLKEKYYISGSENGNAGNAKFVFSYNGCPVDCLGLKIDSLQVSENEEELGKFLDGETISQYDAESDVGKFSKYPYVWQGNNLDNVSYSKSENCFICSLPYGTKPNVAKATYVIGGTVTDSNSNDLTGNYVLEGDKYILEKDNKAYIFGIKSVNSSNRWCIYTESGDSYNVLIYANSNDSNPLTAFSNGNYISGSYYGSTKSGMTISFSPAESEHGSRNSIYAKAEIESYGISNNDNFEFFIYKIVPSEVYFSIVGSSGSQKYTGFYQKDGKFFPSDFITLKVSATSKIGLKCKILSVGNNSVVNEGKEYELPNSGTVLSIKTRISSENGESTIFDKSKKIDLKAVIIDEAGNSVDSNECSIQYITRLFRTGNENLVEASSSYYHKIYSMDSNSPVKISEKTVSATSSTRKWNEIYYPSTHAAPKNADGTINADLALSLAKKNATGSLSDLEASSYDVLALDSTGEALAKDDNGRYYQSVTGGWDTSKTYPAMENSSTSGNSMNTYWIIDNAGESEFKLEFEYFDFSGEVTSYPVNRNAPYSGDMLCVYDASAEGATKEIEDEYGNKVYKIEDSSKLTLLFTLKGSYRNSGTNKYSLIPSNFDGGSITVSGNGFIVSNITSSTRICLVPFTDSGSSGTSVASGFKLKAGKETSVSYSNYDYVNETGEFWIHEVVSSGIDQCNSVSSVSTNYDYYASMCETDCEKGSFRLNEMPDTTVLASFVGMLHLSVSGNPSAPSEYFTGKSISSFITSEDDMQDYIQPKFYVQRSGSSPNKTTYYSLPSHENGRIMANTGAYTVVPDTGIMTFSSGSIPLGRIFGDYSHHTMYRLTSDGYGDLYFYNNGVLIPSSSNETYQDWTYVDLKIVNEGTTNLDSGTIQFIPRGYMTTTNGTSQVVDTVIDANRPWDIQEGTTQETVKCTGARFSSTYAELNANYKATRKTAYQAKSSQTCVFGTLGSKQSAYVRVFWCIANSESGNSWVDVTRGSKTFSAEIAGRYFIFTS